MPIAWMVQGWRCRAVAGFNALSVFPSLDVLMIAIHTHSAHTYSGAEHMASRVGERGQITIEKHIREELGIYAGDETIQRIEDGRIVVDVVPGRHSRSLAGSAVPHIRRHPPDESWPALRDAAWATPDPDRSA